MGAVEKLNEQEYRDYIYSLLDCRAIVSWKDLYEEIASTGLHSEDKNRIINCIAGNNQLQSMFKSKFKQ